MVKGRKLIRKDNNKLPFKINNMVVYNDGKSKLPATIFFVVVALIGWYVIYDQFYRDKSGLNGYINDIDQSIKIDVDKDYVYFNDKDIVININNESLKELESSLNLKKDTLKYDVFDSKNFVSIISYELDNYNTYNINKYDGTICTDDFLFSSFNTSDNELKGDITEEHSYFINNNCLGIIYKDSNNSLGYSSYLTYKCIN